MQSIAEWFNGLTHLQNIMVSFGFVVVFILGSIVFVDWLSRKDHLRVEVLPNITENDLKMKRDGLRKHDDGSMKAFKTYTRKDRDAA